MIPLSNHEGNSPNSPAAISISLEHLSFRYNNAVAAGQLEDISLQIPAGQCVLVTGPSGGGKTTFLRLLNGLIPHYFPGNLSGCVRLYRGSQEINPATAPLWEVGQVTGTVFQNPRTQFFTTDATSEVAFGLENAGVAPPKIAQRVTQITTELGVADLLGQSLFRMSGGQRQLIACAGAGAGKPGLYLLDEPTSNLSATSIDRFAQVLTRLKASGATIVIAEHRQYFLRSLADRVLLVEHGRVTKDLPGAKFFALPAQEISAMGLRTLTVPQFLVPALKTATEDSAPTDMPTLDTIPATPTIERLSPPVAPSGAGLNSATKGDLELRDLRVAYGKKRPLLHIPFLRLPRGCITGITGSNGVGKSTLAAVLTGTKKATSGRILLDGRALNPRDLTRHSYLVMQDVNRQLFADSAINELRLGTKLSPESAYEVLVDFDLDIHAQAHPLSLSGGQKQRLTVAAARTLNRDLYIFDEPSSGLDLGHLQALSVALQELAVAGKIVVLITHDPELMNTVATARLDLDQFSSRPAAS